jgi:hypothetical protein
MLVNLFLLVLILFSFSCCCSNPQKNDYSQYLFGNPALMKLDQFKMLIDFEKNGLKVFIGIPEKVIYPYENPFFDYIKKNYSKYFVPIENGKSHTRFGPTHATNWCTIYMDMLKKTSPPRSLYDAFLELFGIRGAYDPLPGKLCTLLKDYFFNHYQHAMSDRFGDKMFAVFFAYLIYIKLKPSDNHYPQAENYPSSLNRAYDPHYDSGLRVQNLCPNPSPKLVPKKIVRKPVNPDKQIFLSIDPYEVLPEPPVLTLKGYLGTFDNLKISHLSNLEDSQLQEIAEFSESVPRANSFKTPENPIKSFDVPIIPREKAQPRNTPTLKSSRNRTEISSKDTPNVASNRGTKMNILEYMGVFSVSDGTNAAPESEVSNYLVTDDSQAFKRQRIHENSVQPEPDFLPHLDDQLLSLPEDLHLTNDDYFCFRNTDISEIDAAEPGLLEEIDYLQFS